MTKILVLCNHVNGAQALTAETYDKTLSINPAPPGQNLQIHITNIEHRILSEFNRLAQDLLEIASYVYYADCSLARGAESDVYADRWQRRLDFMIPVSDPDVWNRSEIRSLLEESLGFLSDDQISFTFTPPKPIPPYMAASDVWADCQKT